MAGAWAIDIRAGYDTPPTEEPVHHSPDDVAPSREAGCANRATVLHRWWSMCLWILKKLRSYPTSAVYSLVLLFVAPTHHKSVICLTAHARCDNCSTIYGAAAAGGQIIVSGSMSLGGTCIGLPRQQNYLFIDLLPVLDKLKSRESIDKELLQLTVPTLCFNLPVSVLWLLSDGGWANSRIDYAIKILGLIRTQIAESGAN